MKNAFDDLAIDNMSQQEARQWLIESDPEAADFWRNLPEDTNFREDVRVNCRDFGYDLRPSIKSYIDHDKIVITACVDVLSAIEDLLIHEPSTLVDLLCDSYGYEREKAGEIVSEIECDTPLYEVQTLMVSDWENCWTDDNGEKIVYRTRKAAQAAIDEMLENVRNAVLAGDMAEEYDPSDYRIVKV